MTSTDLAVGGAGTLALTGEQTAWTPVQAAALAHIGIQDAPPGDQQVFMHVAQRTGLDPFRRQIYMIKRTEKGEDKWTIQTGIDGFRLVAEDHPQYAGTLDPEWCGPDGVWREVWTAQTPPVAARVKVLRHDRPHPIVLPVRFTEFAATFKDGGLMGQWRSKPAHMIAKCAEAASLRKAFPRQLAGVYTDDEMAARAETVGRAYEHAPTARVTVAELTGQAILADVDSVRAAIAACTTVDQLKDIRDDINAAGLAAVARDRVAAIEEAERLAEQAEMEAELAEQDGATS